MALPSAPQISVQALTIAGLISDVYGVAELSPKAHSVSCLWLHHARTNRKEDMRDIASRCVGAWNAFPGSRERGLIAVAYDQRNHGTRLVDETTNGAWREGNPNHAVDMWGMINGMVVDQGLLLDLIEGYLFPANERRIDQHLALGISLGGHSVWQLMFADKRVRAGVAVIGCPDYQYLMTDRARLSRRPAYSSQDDGASFLGSRDFPLSLIQACRKFDPKGIFFGTYAVPSPESEAGGSARNSRASHQAYIRQQMLYERLQGKQILLCSGGEDKLVPMRCAEPFMQWFKHAASVTPLGREDQRFSVDDRVYAGVGHEFSPEMVRDAVQFIVHAVAGAREDRFGAYGGEDGGENAQMIFSKV